MALNSLAKLMEMIESHSTRLQFPATGNFKYNYVRERLFAIFKETHIRKLRGMLSWTKSEIVEVVVFGEHAVGLASQMQSCGFKSVKALKPEKDIPRLFIFAPDKSPTKEDVELLQLVLNETNNEACSLVSVALTTDAVSQKGRLVTKEDIVKEILLECPAGDAVLTKLLDAISSDILFWNNERDITEKVFLYMMEAVDNAMTDFLKVVQNLITGLEERRKLESKMKQYLNPNPENIWKIEQVATTINLMDDRGRAIQRQRQLLVKNEETLAHFMKKIRNELFEYMGRGLIHLLTESRSGVEAKLSIGEVVSSFLQHIPNPDYSSLQLPLDVNGKSYREKAARGMLNDIKRHSDKITETLLSVVFHSVPDDSDDRPNTKDFEKLKLLQLEMKKLSSKVKIYINPDDSSVHQVPIIPELVKAEFYKSTFIKAFGIIFGKLHVYVDRDLLRQRRKLLRGEIKRMVSSDEFCQDFCIVEWSPNSKIIPYGFGVGSKLSMSPDRDPRFGTLGCLAFVDGKAEEVYALTCEHVARKCNFVEHEGGFLPVGTIKYSKLATWKPMQDFVDIAFIELSAAAKEKYVGDFMAHGEPYDCSLFMGNLGDLEGERVQKDGAATGYTEGIVVGNLDVKDIVKSYCNLLLVESVGDEPFAKPGDSGSVVVMKSDCAPNSLLAVSMIHGRLNLTEELMSNKSTCMVTFGLRRAITDAECTLGEKFTLQQNPLNMQLSSIH